MQRPVLLKLLSRSVHRPDGGPAAGLLVASVLLGMSATAQGQSGVDNLSSAPPEPLSVGQASSTQGSQGNRRLAAFVPSISVENTWTDNIRVTGGAGKTSDFVTAISPSFRFTSEGDRLKANVDYSLTRFLHARDRSLDRNQNALAAVGSFEMAENFAFVDFSGNISQQTISAFGPRSSSQVTDNQNRTETAVYRVSPYIRGQLGDVAQYQARYGRTALRAKSSLIASDYDLDDLSVQLTSTSEQRVFGWSVDASHQRQDYASGLSYQADRVRAFLTYPFSPQVSLSLIPGWESNNYVSQDKVSRVTFGGQIRWALSDRTNVSALLEKRFFGSAHMLSFEHRTPRTAWRLSDSRDASSTASQVGSAGVGSLYDLYFFQFTSIEPDPTRRAQLVNAFLLANGLDGRTNVDLGFLTSAVTLSRRQDASFTLIGVRDTLSVMASQSETSRLSQINTNDDLSNSSYVRQHGFSIVYSRRLTPQSTFSAIASTARSRGQDSALQASDIRSLSVSLSTRLGEHTTGSVGLRRTVSDNTSSSYNESAVHGGLSFQF